MDTATITIALQALVGLGLLNVWLLRARSGTAYRGGESQSLKQEFEAYGLSEGAFYTVGALKIGCAIALLAGIWNPELVAPAAGIIVVLMLGALAMHVRVHDALIKSVPAFLMLAMSSSIVILSLDLVSGA